MNRFICIHGHFYQPPRENPWLEAVEVQDSAYPFRDWNERITAECYSPNTASRIFDANRRIVDIVNNYSKISFNFGPTLLSWMEEHTPEVYQGILDADIESRKNFSGHGSAIAQVYNHMIMPLSHPRDQKTQAIWGIEDFRYRFGREPESIWLAETAVNTDTLEVLADLGIKFTILAPHQAGKIKLIGDDEWTDVSESKIDPKRAYLCRLPSGNQINLFFYDGAISQELAFGNLLKNGENLAGRLTQTFREDDQPQLVHIATDGETYGHHQKHGDMALAYCLHYIESNNLAKITNYGEFLENFPPEYEAQIIDNTSWSCAHGIERWRSDCGCNSGRPGWKQEWRAPLRFALDWLRDELSPLYEEKISKYVKDPWKLRDDYIQIILNRAPENIDRVFKASGIKRDLSEEEKVAILKLLEMERHAMLMYTSCGWFFDEISGIETMQVILYAARAIQLANSLFGKDLEPEFVKKLKGAPSNIPEVGDGANAYRMYVKPAIIDLQRVAAHYAVSSLFENYSENPKIFSYEVFIDFFERMEAGKTKMVIGKTRMRSRVTYETIVFSFAFMHLGDHNVNGGVRETLGEEAFREMYSEMKEAFKKLNIAEIILLMDKHFETHNYTLWHLFKDESRKVFNKILAETVADIDHTFREIYLHHYAIMQAMKDANTPIPKEMKTVLEYSINADFKKALLSSDKIKEAEFTHLVDEAKKWQVEIDRATIGFLGSQRITDMMNELKKSPADIELLKDICSITENLQNIQIDVDLWKAQNALFELHKDIFDSFYEKAAANDELAKEWVTYFAKLEKLMDVELITDKALEIING